MPKTLLVFSDTHRQIEAPLAAIFNTPHVDRLVHLGDLVADAEELARLSNRTILMVRGNNDWMDMDVPPTQILELAGHRIYLTHGHREGVYHRLDQLAHICQTEACDIALFGHTHCFTDEKIAGVRLINPGAISWPRGGDGRRSYLRLTLQDNGQVDLDRILL